MSSEAGPPPAGDPFAGGEGAPVEDEQMREARAAYEAELARITVPDMLMQATVSLLNLAARRLVPEGAEGRDLDQVRDAIDGVRALLEILERRIPGELRPLRDALSQLQLAYAAEVQRSGAEHERAGTDKAGTGEPGEGDGEPGGGGSSGGESGSGGGEPGSGGGEPGSGGGEPGTGGGSGTGGGEPAKPGATEPGQRRPGPAESSGRLWVPGS